MLAAPLSSMLRALGAAEAINRMIDLFSSYEQVQMRVTLIGGLKDIIGQYEPRISRAGRPPVRPLPGAAGNSSWSTNKDWLDPGGRRRGRVRYGPSARSCRLIEEDRVAYDDEEALQVVSRHGALRL